MNVRIDKQTRLQSWKRNTIFGDYPVHIRAGNLTITLLFADVDSLRRLGDLLEQTLKEITRFFAKFDYPSSATRPLEIYHHSGTTYWQEKRGWPSKLKIRESSLKDNSLQERLKHETRSNRSSKHSHPGFVEPDSPHGHGSTGCARAAAGYPADPTDPAGSAVPVHKI